MESRGEPSPPPVVWVLDVLAAVAVDVRWLPWLALLLAGGTPFTLEIAGKCSSMLAMVNAGDSLACSTRVGRMVFVGRGGLPVPVLAVLAVPPA